MDPAGPAFRLSLPCRWSLTGRVRCRRPFGYPGRIDEHERVWLTLRGVAGRARVALNGTTLGDAVEAGGAEFEATSLLRPRNELVVEVKCSAGDAGPWDEVALEVRCIAFLRGVRAWIVVEAGGAVLHVAGEVVGEADRPLDLYVILGRSPLAEAQFEPLPAGRAFHLTAPGLDPARLQGSESVRVELVNGATVWYGTEVRAAAKSPGGGGV
jgi:hypothetical protein